LQFAQAIKPMWASKLFAFYISALYVCREQYDIIIWRTAVSSKQLQIISV